MLRFGNVQVKLGQVFLKCRHTLPVLPDIPLLMCNTRLLLAQTWNFTPARMMLGGFLARFGPVPRTPTTRSGAAVGLPRRLRSPPGCRDAGHARSQGLHLHDALDRVAVAERLAGCDSPMTSAGRDATRSVVGNGNQAASSAWSITWATTTPLSGPQEVSYGRGTRSVSDDRASSVT